MVGKYILEVSSKHIKYRLELERCITVIRGDSGTGKTSLLNMIQQRGRGVSVLCNKVCDIIVLTYLDIYDWVGKMIDNGIIFIEENFYPVWSNKFIDMTLDSGNYIVLVSRFDMGRKNNYVVNHVYSVADKSSFDAVVDKESYR